MTLNPNLIIADEPISMIDVSLRARILELMLQLREEIALISAMPVPNPKVKRKRIELEERFPVL